MTYARTLKALGQKRDALNLMQSAEIYHNGNAEFASEYGRTALELEQLQLADKLLTYADNANSGDWRVVSARGTLLAKQGQYAASIPFYERALKMSPGQPSVLNNLAMAHAASGEAGKAEGLLRQAGAETTDDARIRQNLVLVLGAVGKTDEAQRVAGMTGAEARAAQAQMAPVAIAQAPVLTPAPQAAPVAVAAAPASKAPQAVASVTTVPPAAKIAKVVAKTPVAPAAPAEPELTADALIAKAKAMEASFHQSLPPSRSSTGEQAALSAK